VSSEREKLQSAEGVAGSRRPLSASSKDVRQAFDLSRGGRYLTQSLRKHPYGWMGCAALVGWVLVSRLPTKKQTVDALPSGKNPPNRVGKTARLHEEKLGKATPKMLSLALELFTAVGLAVLKQQVKAWGFARFARHRHAAPAEGAPARRVPNQSARRDPPEKQSKTKAGRRRPGKFSSAHALELLKTTAAQWAQDKCPQLGAALAYYTVFSLAPLVLVLLAVFGLIFGGSEHAREKITEQLRYFLDPSGVKVIQDIAANASKPKGGILATTIGVIIALFGASGVFGQLQNALNTIWGVKPKPGRGLWGFVRTRFLSFGMVGGVCFLLLVSLTVESLLKGFNGYLKSALPGGDVVALAVFFAFDLAVIILLFAMIFRYLPDAKIAWRDVWIGAALTAGLFAIGKFVLGLYLGSGAAGSAYGAASSLITLLLWVFYAAQIMLFGAEFTQVYANAYGSQVEPEGHAVKVERKEIEVPTGRL
jgi:membrane protein